MAESVVKEGRTWRFAFAVAGIMSTLVVYGVLQEKIMRVPYGKDKEYFKYSLFLVFCNRITTSAVSAGALLASKKTLDPVAPIYKYCAISVSNILTTTCQYEALKYVSFPVQTLAKCAKMIPVMVWGTVIMQKKYNGKDYLFALLVTLGCSFFILYPASTDVSPYNAGRESTIWGVSLMIGYLGFDGFTSTFQDKLFKGYDMEIHNQIFYTTTCSCILSLFGLVVQGHLFSAIEFMFLHHDCFFDVVLLSSVSIFLSSIIVTISSVTVYNSVTYIGFIAIPVIVFFWHPKERRRNLRGFSLFKNRDNNIIKERRKFLSNHCFMTIQVATTSQFFISYTIRTFGALTFATIMTTRQLLSIMLSCVWFAHPLSWEQWIGAAIVFGSLYAKTFLRTKEQKPVSVDPVEGVELNTENSKSEQ